jgi:oxygen-independent coproporphyrinogen III oxidase
MPVRGPCSSLFRERRWGGGGPDRRHGFWRQFRCNVSLGIYISVPFCRSKCTYCNFASGVFSPGQMGKYVERLCQDIRGSRALAVEHHAEAPALCDSLYLGGGTPSLLPPDELKKLFSALWEEFQVTPDAEVTVECAPGTLTNEIIATLTACGVNRVSLGVQSFVDQEAASVARLHTREKTLSDIARLRGAGIANLNVDLIAGLPHQTDESWNFSLQQAVATGVPHVSVYMLEVDDDSRLGRELIAGGAKYHAHFVPDDEATAGFYEVACAGLNAAGVEQYEISNFARAGYESRHNLKYWTRQPYLGFGVDAHSMLPASPRLGKDGIISLRLATTDSFDQFFQSPGFQATPINAEQALEESFFLGLRLNRGLVLDGLRREFGAILDRHEPALQELVAAGLLERRGDVLQLTPRGRLLSNEVFERVILSHEPAKEITSAGR